MRRFVSVALALVMSLCVTVPAFAAKTGQAITFGVMILFADAYPARSMKGTM